VGEIDSKEVEVYGRFPKPIEPTDRWKIFDVCQIIKDDEIKSIFDSFSKKWEKWDDLLSFYIDASFFVNHAKLQLFMYVAGLERWHDEQFPKENVYILEKLKRTKDKIGIVYERVFDRFGEELKEGLEELWNGDYEQFLDKFFERAKDTRNAIAHASIAHPSRKKHVFEKPEEFIKANELLRLIFRACLLEITRLKEERIAEILIGEEKNTRIK